MLRSRRQPQCSGPLDHDAPALADEAPTELAGQNAPIVEDYTYSTKLDVAKVLSMSTIPEVCEVVPVKMEYEDSQGQRHILNYHVMGNGCSNG